MSDPVVTYFDGQSAKAHQVNLTVRGAAIAFGNRDVKNQVWEYGELSAVEPARQGEALRLTCSRVPGARLIVPAGQQAKKILEMAPGLASRGYMKKLTPIGVGVGGSLLAAFVVFYLMLNLAPRSIARIMPDSWRQRVGVSTEKAMVKSARRCNQPAGEKALLKLAGRVANASDTPPDFSVRVYKMKMVNAFAAPGGRMVITAGLIRAAETPNEVAGVLAHELGHVYYRHPEAAMVRILGIQLLVSLATGGGDGETLGNLAGIATFLSYSRDAEEQADGYAQKILKASHIGTAGLVAFFERIRKQEKRLNLGKAGKLLSIFSTHPGTDSRIRHLKKQMPKGAPSKQVLTPLEWQALKAICDQAKRGTAS